MKHVKFFGSAILAALFILGAVFGIVGLNDRYKESRAIDSIRASLNYIHTEVEKGVTIESYHALLAGHLKVLKDAEPKINVKKRENDLLPLTRAAIDYAIVMALWIEQADSEIAMEHDIIVLRDNMIPPEVNRMALVEASRLTIESVFRKSDGGRFAAVGAYILPKKDRVQHLLVSRRRSP